jgi:aldose sugar dehydrogenase
MRIRMLDARWTFPALAIALCTLTGAAQQQTPAAGRQGGPPAGGRQGGAGFPRVPPLPFPDSPQEFDTLGPRIRVVPYVKGLSNPWSIAFLPNGDMLVTEKPGRLRIVRNGTLAPEPVSGVPAVFANGQGGLLEVLPHPKFAENQFLYLTYSKPGENNTATTALARGKFDGKALTEVKDLFVADNWNTGGAHFGSKLAFGRDGMLYMTVGERNDRVRAQNTASHGGKLLRLTDDGTVPPDNPFVKRDGHKPEIYSYGHRNAQGLAIHPETGAVWLNEHGPQGGDELNVAEPAKNYGWPVVSFGREYSGDLITNQPYRDGMEPPAMIWVPSIGISGMAFYTGDRFPQWKGHIFVGGLSGQHVQRVVFTEKGPIGRETLLGSMRQRVRDVRQGPDGLLYVAIDGATSGILRIEPAAGATSSGQ